MTFHPNFKEGLHPNREPENLICFSCCEPIDHAAVRFDGYDAPGVGRSLYLHPLCASEMGQRLICDGWPHRKAR